MAKNIIYKIWWSEGVWSPKFLSAKDVSFWYEKILNQSSVQYSIVDIYFPIPMK